MVDPSWHRKFNSSWDFLFLSSSSDPCINLLVLKDSSYICLLIIFSGFVLDCLKLNIYVPLIIYFNFLLIFCTNKSLSFWEYELYTPFLYMIDLIN